MVVMLEEGAKDLEIEGSYEVAGRPWLLPSSTQIVSSLRGWKSDLVQSGNAKNVPDLSQSIGRSKKR
jgi:hypothetical protein